MFVWIGVYWYTFYVFVCVCICACLYMQIHKLGWNFAVIIDVRCRLISVIHWDTCWLLCETTTGNMFEALSLLRSAPENFEGFVWCYTVTNLQWRTVWLWSFFQLASLLLDQFTYLGRMVTADAKSDQEIKRRIGIAKMASKKMERVLESKSVTIATRLRLLKCYVWSTLLWRMDHQQDYGSSHTGSRNVVSTPNDEDFMAGQDIKRWSATPSQHHQTVNADNHLQANPFRWRCYEKSQAGILDADWENRGQKSTGSPTFDISRLIGTIYWHKPLYLITKLQKRWEQYCGCRQCQDSGMTVGLIDWIDHCFWFCSVLWHFLQCFGTAHIATTAC